MKRYLIVFGLILTGLSLTFLVTEAKNSYQSDQKHSRVNHYADYVLSSYIGFKNLKPNLKGRIKFLNSDSTHGLVGLDPWGRPYEYFIQPKENSPKELIITLWSKGRDYKKQLTPSKVKSSNYFYSRGDDYVFSKTVKI